MKRRNFIWYFLLLVASCRGSIRQWNRNVYSWRKYGPKKLRFTVTDVFGLEQLEQDYGAFCQALSEVLGIEIEISPVNNLVEAALAFLSNNLDLALAGPSEYLILRARARAVPLFALTRPNYYTVVSVRSDSGITNLVQLKGKKIGLRSEASTASHLGTTKLLMDVGLEPKVDFITVMVGDRGVEMLMTGEIDAWGDAVARWRRFVAQAGLSEQELPIIARGEPLPNDIFVANPNLHAQFIDQMRSLMLDNEEKLMEAILKGPANDKYKDSKMVVGNDTDYDVIRQLYQAIGQEEFVQ